MENTVLITITGVGNYYGKKPFKIGRIVKLEKEPDNEYDPSAVVVTLPYINKIGYVANSVNTVFDGTYSASRLYDKFEKAAYAQVMVVTHSSVIARLLPDEEVTDKF